MSQQPTDKKPKVLVTFDSMKHANSGFFYFGKSLGDGILKLNNNRFDLTYFVAKNALYQFGDKVKKKFLSPLYKLKFLKSSEYDLVHFTDQYCRLKPQMVKAKKILTIHDLNHLHEKRKSAQKIEQYLNRLKARAAECDYIIAISHFVANDIATHIPEAKSRIRVIYNGADELRVDESHIPAIVPEGDFIFTIGSVFPKKNFHVLPALLNGNNWKLVISGNETSYVDEIKNEARKHHCEDRVIITGPVIDADRAWYYQHCAAFALPSKAEGFGLPVIEAMYFGKPVFLSTFTSLPEIGGDVAYYFDSFEPEAMQRVFETGMKDFTENNRANAIKLHAAKFNWDICAASYLALYQECLDA
jgi:glycosyltransferase involved in cell wall biosynthesis